MKFTEKQMRDAWNRTLIAKAPVKSGRVPFWGMADELDEMRREFVRQLFIKNPKTPKLYGPLSDGAYLGVTKDGVFRGEDGDVQHVTSCLSTRITGLTKANDTPDDYRILAAAFVAYEVQQDA